MAVTVTVELPPEVERQVRESISDLDSVAKEAFLVSLYRQGKLSHFALSKALGLDRFQTEAVLARHNVTEDLGTVDEYLKEAANVERVRAKS